MNDIKKLYDLWVSSAVNDKDLIPELDSIKGDEEAILDRFYKNLEFGTAGLRGVIGAGTNRMNVYTVAQATQGLASLIHKEFISVFRNRKHLFSYFAIANILYIFVKFFNHFAFIIS